MTGAQAPEVLRRLREATEKIQHFHTDSDQTPLALGVPEADSKLGGGLAYGALHEISPDAPIHLGAACGFTLALAALAAKGGRETLWIQTDFARIEAGAAYGPGLGLFGLPSQRLLMLRVTRPADALFAMEEALKCRALGSVVAELPDDSADLTTTRRLSLAARDNGRLGLLLRHRTDARPSAAMTRWSIAAAAGPRDAAGGIGATAFQLSLIKNRRGPCGRWHLVWKHHDCVFVPAAVSLGVAAASADRPHRTATA